MTRTNTSTKTFVSRRGRRTGAIALSLALAAVAAAAGACGPSAATPTPGAATPTPLVTPFIPTPSPTLQRVVSVTLVAPIMGPADATFSGLAWKGAQAGAVKAGAKSTLVQPADNAVLAAAVESAAAGDRAVVIVIGPVAANAAATSAVAHPETQFLVLGVDPGASAPANVHGLVFDSAEAGYLAGFIAASFSASGSVGYVGTTAADAASAAYLAGFSSGAVLARADVKAASVLAGSATSPDHGRTAAATLVAGGADVVVAATSNVGIAALRQACSAKTRLVAIETDASATVTDVRACLVASVLLRSDTAVEAAIANLASGGTLERIVAGDVAGGDITVSELHADPPAGFVEKLEGVLAALRNSPPRPGAAPASTAP